MGRGRCISILSQQSRSGPEGTLQAMTTLRIFGDESGEIAIDDNDGPFVAATVSFLGDNPIIHELQRRSDLFVNQLKEIKAIPRVAFVYPQPGYGERLAKKYSKINTMARVTRLITGANEQYLTRGGIELRNHIWSRCMGGAIIQAIVSAIAIDSIDNVVIVLDQRSLAKPQKNLFRRTLNGIRANLDNILNGIERLKPIGVAGLKANPRFSQDSMSILFSDDPAVIDAEGGLLLADHLAKLFLRDLRHASKCPIKKELEKGGFSHCDKDLTEEILLSPV